MIKELIKWKPLLIGIILAVTLYIVSDIISGQSILLVSFIMAGIAVGFMIGNIKKGVLENHRFSKHQNIVLSAINGALLGLLGGAIVSSILLATMYIQGYGDYLSMMLSTIFLYIGLEIVMSTIGGVFGSLIRLESNS
ncbi:MAG TPA: hypothetical protein VK426_01390 [Methanobacterium sp.]|nr:hypothetical protein [Methanobacterium sp.]